MVAKIKNHLYWLLNIDELYNKMPDEKFLKLRYKKRLGKELNLTAPQTFCEKIQWLKLYNRRPEYSVMVDKYAAKEYVAAVLGKNYITPTIGVWNRFDEIDFDKLPEKFVLKCTHNSGGLLICDGKSAVDWKKGKERIEKALKKNYYFSSREWPYKEVPPRIIAEEYMENNEEGLHDYKVWCFNGKPVYIQYITGRNGKQTYEGFYDLDWRLQDFSYHNPRMPKPAARPGCLEELIQAAGLLAKNQPFVRTDFYVLEDGSLRFGEITFYPMSGMERWHPEEMDKILGGMIDLDFGKH